MSAEFLVTTLVRWLGLSALAGLCGGLVVELLVLPRAAPEVARARRRLRRWSLIWIAGLAVATAGELVIRGQTMAGGDLAVGLAAIPVMLARTHFGSIWIARSVALGLLLLVAFAAARRARAVTLVLAVAVAATTAFTGHAGDWGDLTPSSAIDWVHILASAAWTGGLLCLALVVLVEARAWPSELLAASMRRFSRLAGWFLLAVVLSGGYNAWVQLPAVSALWTTAYGRVLAVKLCVVLALIWWGAVSRYTIVSRLGSGRASGLGVRLFRLGRLVLLGSSRVARRSLPSRLSTNVLREAALALVVFGCTAILIDSTPARHAGHAARHQTEAETEPGPVRVTMSELHASGGVPRGWLMSPPAGDATRGREVFARLACFACHKIAGEKFPPSSGLGPDLTGAGGHHPAGYLLESIINPNAVVVEGRGYTDPDGKSIMPDYSARLSVSELIDLVAYLKSR